MAEIVQGNQSNIVRRSRKYKAIFVRSQSLDPHHDRSSSEADLMDSPRPTFPQYRVLADYTALTGREVNLQEGEVVELVKIGCAGWWYVRLPGYSSAEGWAPSTYMEKLPARYRTLDRP